MKQEEIKVEVVEVDELIQDDKNFNKGCEQGAQLIERSFKEFGAGRSVFIDKDNRLVGGNKAQKGFKAAGKKKVIIVDSDADTLVAVRRKDVSLDSAEGRKMAYLDNLTTQVNLTWDQTELEAVQADVDGFDIADFGFDIEDLPQVTFPGENDGKEAKAKEYTDVQEDDFDPDAKYETKVQKGEVWQLGEHRLMCGDSTKKEDIAKLMGGELADLWITDPPYNVDYQEKEQYKKDLGIGANVHSVAIANDKMKNDEFLQFLVDAYAAAKDVMKPGAAFYIWHADTEGLNFRIALDKVGNMKLCETLIWVKNQMVFGRQDYHWKHEPCLYGWKEGAGHKWCSDRKQNTVLEFDRPQRSEEHPTMKPVGLFAYQIQNSTDEGDIVLDDFGGSGTTIVACEQLKRKARLMEFEPHYCNVIIARWEKLTGQKAVKLNL